MNNADLSGGGSVEVILKKSIRSADFVKERENLYKSRENPSIKPIWLYDSSGIVDDNPHDSAKSDLRVSLVDNVLVGPYSATVLVTLSLTPDHRPPRLESAR
ncbi:hypothetical protein TNCV_3157821 [Trichonephila clavipes]|nr:hypothetical protein TNCV_3157821 [Trichonephila clavipes]